MNKYLSKKFVVSPYFDSDHEAYRATVQEVSFLSPELSGEVCICYSVEEAELIARLLNENEIKSLEQVSDEQIT